MEPRFFSFPLPVGWKSQRAKLLFKERNTKAHGSEEPLSASQVYGIVPQSTLEATLDRQVMFASKGYENFKLVEKGDFVISLRSFEGGLEYSAYKGVISPAYSVLQRNLPLYDGYYRHYFKCEEYIQRINAVLTGIRDGKTIRYEDFASLDLPIPPTEQQSSIASYLDFETSRIDALISKKERQIELLQEKRQAIITHAVTKGLDPNAKMKDSGIEWIGEIPEGWTMWRLRHVAPLQGGYAFKSELFRDEGVRVIRMNNLKRGRLYYDEAPCIAIEEIPAPFMLCEGDLLLGMSGSVGVTGSLGNFAVVRSDDLPCALNQRVGRFLSNRLLRKDFLKYIIQTKLFTDPLILNSTGTAQFNVSAEQVGEVQIPLPSETEQERIADFLDIRIQEIANLQESIANSISLLGEYRSSLITAAVSGQIDVSKFTNGARVNASL